MDIAQDPLFENDPRAHARGSDPATSYAAATLLGPRAGTMRRRLLGVFAFAPATAEEASERAGYGPEHGAWKRVSDLKLAGLIRPTGETRSSVRGRQQDVLEITALGRELL